MTGTENLTTMFTDIVGFTERTARLSRREQKGLLGAHDRVLLPIVRLFGGRRVKSVGDGMLLTFRSPTDAVKCAMAMHDALYAYNQGRAEDEQIHIRAALNSGEVQVERNDVFGDAINVASRLEGITPDGEVYLTQSVHLAMNRAEVPVELVGTETFKGVGDPVEVFRVPRRGTTGDGSPYGTGGADALPPDRGRVATASSGTGFGRRAVLGSIAGGVAVIIAVLVVMTYTGSPEDVSELKVQALAALEEDDPQTAAALVGEHVREHPEDAEATLLMGHAQIDQGQYESAAQNYLAALDLDASLASDPRLVSGLLDAVGSSDAIRPVVIRSGSDELVDGLASLSAAEDPARRDAAADLLIEMGKGNRVDYVGKALRELVGADACEDKLRSIKTLRRLDDARALPALRELADDARDETVDNRCYRAELTETVAQLGGAPLPSGGTATPPAASEEEPGAIGRILQKLSQPLGPPSPNAGANTEDKAGRK